jgi:hypothetical protein
MRITTRFSSVAYRHDGGFFPPPTGGSRRHRFVGHHTGAERGGGDAEIRQIIRIFINIVEDRPDVIIVRAVGVEEIRRARETRANASPSGPTDRQNPAGPGNGSSGLQEAPRSSSKRARVIGYFRIASRENKQITAPMTKVTMPRFQMAWGVWVTFSPALGTW